MESESPKKEVKYRGLITLSIMLGTIMQVLDSTIANVALPHMQGSLAATQNQVAWVLTSYIVASAIMTLPSGWFAVRYGGKRVFIVAVTAFTISSALCGLALSIEQIVFFRILQGMSGAALIPISQATLLDINPKEKHGSAMAIWGAGIMIGPIIGPTLGGYLTEYYNWRWVFFINVPLGIITVLGISLFMPEPEPQKKRRFDWLGFLTLAITIGCAQLILNRGEQVDWFDSREIFIYFAIAGSAIWMYVIHTMQTDNPILPPAMFLDRNLVTSLFFMFFVGLILLATVALLPPYMQNLMGYPVLEVGTLMAPRGAGTMVAMILVGRLVNRVDPRALILFGLSLTVISLNAMTQFSTFVPASTLMWTGLLQGFGLGFIFVPLNTIAYTTLDPKYRAEAASVFNLTRNMGASVGISIVMTVLGRNIQTNHAYLTEYITPYTLGISWKQVPDGLMSMSSGLMGALNGEITRQAATIAYVNDFKLMMWVVIASIPFIFLLKNPRKPQADALTKK